MDLEKRRQVRRFLFLSSPRKRGRINHRPIDFEELERLSLQQQDLRLGPCFRRDDIEYCAGAHRSRYLFHQ
jgi:hypothetical protein